VRTETTSWTDLDPDGRLRFTRRTRAEAGTHCQRLVALEAAARIPPPYGFARASSEVTEQLFVPSGEAITVDVERGG
jgi:hypothetical protein